MQLHMYTYVRNVSPEASVMVASEGISRGDETRKNWWSKGSSDLSTVFLG